jgi:hypothetical protein
MSPPRTPRGEKPATTIRLLRRQLSIAQATVAALQLDRSDKEKVIAGYDAQIEETDRELIRTQSTVAEQAWRIGDLEQRIRFNSERLAYLEGYHAKSQETRSIPTPIPSLPSYSPEAQARRRAGDTENLSDRRQRGQGPRTDEGPAGFGARLGDPLWRQPGSHIPHPQGNSVEHIEVTENGISRDRSQRSDICHHDSL